MLLGSLALALGVDRFIRIVGFARTCWDFLVHCPSRWELLGSSSVVYFTRVRPGGRWIHPRSCLGSLWVHRGSLCSLARAVSVIAFILGRWVHSRAPWGSLSSSWVIEFTRVRCRCRSVHSQSLGSLAHSLVVITARSVHSRVLWMFWG